jgi:hypothetical protein
MQSSKKFEKGSRPFQKKKDKNSGLTGKQGLDLISEKIHKR